MCIRDRAYKETLQRLGEMRLSDDVHFLNTPHALLRALDKKETKQVLVDSGLRAVSYTHLFGIRKM